MSALIPRDYQREMVWQVLQKLRQYRSTLVVAATGTGKTVAGGLLCQVWQQVDPRRVLVLVHRDELLQQFVATLREMCPGEEIEIEAGDARASHQSNGGFWGCSRIVVASKDTLCHRSRLRHWAPDEIGLMLVDEAHHCVPTNATYVRILDYFQGYKLVGITATADRRDGVAMGNYFESLAYVYDIRDAGADGWLVPIQQQFEMVTGWDLREVRNYKGDLSYPELDRQMKREKPLHTIATAARKYACYGGERRPTLIFCTSVEHARGVANILNDWEKGTACALDGQTDIDTRRAELARFREGGFQFLCGMNLLTEGFDEPRIRVIVIGRVTCSRALYAQMVGRGTRVWPDIVGALGAASSAEERHAIIRASPKPSLLVVDMVGVSAQHKLITAVDLLGGLYPAKVREEAAALISSRPTGRMELAAALREAKLRLEERERKRRSGVILKAKLESIPVDPFELLDIEHQREPGWARGKSPSEKMLKFLVREEVPFEGDISFWEARTLIDAIVKKKNDGPPTPKQASLLSRFGFLPERMTFLQAKEAIDLIGQNNWHLPEDLPAALASFRGEDRKP